MSICLRARIGLHHTSRHEHVSEHGADEHIRRRLQNEESSTHNRGSVEEASFEGNSLAYPRTRGAHHSLQLSNVKTLNLNANNVAECRWNLLSPRRAKGKVKQDNLIDPRALSRRSSALVRLGFVQTGFAGGQAHREEPMHKTHWKMTSPQLRTQHRGTIATPGWHVAILGFWSCSVLGPRWC